MRGIKDAAFWNSSEGRALLAPLYGEEKEVLDYQAERFGELCRLFERDYGSLEGVRFFSAPGRSEIAGNHTDHQLGKVIAASVDLDVIAAVRPREDKVIELSSLGYARCERVALDDLSVRASDKGRSAALIRGVAAGVKDAGYKIGGFSVYTTSLVPSGSGLSSSAAFEILLVTILNYLYNNNEIPPLEQARIGQYAENVHFGKPSGLLDQSGCAIGGFAYLDFAGGGLPYSEQIRVDFKAAGYDLIITQTGGSHANLTHEYAAIPEEMKQVAEALGKTYMSEVEPEDFYADIKRLRKVCGDRAVLRGMHFITEQARVSRQVEDLKNKNIEDFLAKVNESGLSSELLLQNITPKGETRQQEVALALALSREFLKERSGAVRVHGGGFGGTIQAYIRREDSKAYCEMMEKVYGRGSSHIIRIRPCGGTEL